MAILTFLRSLLGNDSTHHITDSTKEHSSRTDISDISDVSDSETKEVSNETLTVTWDGPDDPSNPKNWSTGQKWAASCFSTSPALTSIGEEFHIKNEVQLQLILSIFLLAYALGPFILSPCSEIWGRVRVIRFGNLIFILFTTLCGFSASRSQITAFRFLAGVGGSASVGMGSGVLTDCWRPEERGRGIAIYQLAGVLGPAIGPIVGGYMTQYTTWRWCFFTIVITNITVQIFAFFFLRETYPPRILFLKAQAMRERSGNQKFQTEWEQSENDRTLLGLLRITLSRPWVMLGTQPIIQVLAVYQAFNFGTLYLLISGFPALWEGWYGMPRGDATLNYISLAVGSLIGVNICGPATDRVYASLKRHHGISENEPGLPEFRVPLMIPASIISPCGIFLFAWSAQTKLHFLIPNLGAAIFAGSSIISYQCISAYISDSYSLHSASASAACSFLRSTLAFCFPLFVPALFGQLGYGWGGSVVGLASVVLGIPAPWVIWVYGRRLRQSGRFTSGD
ncbi:MFS multidrug transporter [Lasiosphaeris hirsuta]|uniref:MFS multidrug transporter n=1 Tax=Lasiosphaeris hirsuta TaxID=260670 RepID=A0AA39ZR46_9PEZI|nr:MFS multidrug transporter [Lasiosphaeris hirsuta]